MPPIRYVNLPNPSNIRTKAGAEKTLRVHFTKASEKRLQAYISQKQVRKDFKRTFHFIKEEDEDSSDETSENHQEILRTASSKETSPSFFRLIFS